MFLEIECSLFIHWIYIFYYSLIVSNLLKKSSINIYDKVLENCPVTYQCNNLPNYLYLNVNIDSFFQFSSQAVAQNVDLK